MKSVKNTKVLTIVLAASMFLACLVDVAIAAPKDLLNILTNIPGATAYKYGITDNQGSGMDCLKVIANPAGGYLGIYHHNDSGFKVYIATSTDLLNWTRRATLDVGGHQPTIEYHLATGGFLIVYETDVNGVKFRWYNSLDDLLSGNDAYSYAAPKNLSRCAEGTPSVYRINDDASLIEIGMHFYDDCKVDQNATAALTGLRTGSRIWKASRWGAYNDKLISYGVNHNIGDRDYFSYNRGRYSIQEGRLNSSWGSWRSWLYDYSTEDFSLLKIQTHKGSIGFGNGTVSNIDGRIIVTHFLFEAEPGEGGPMIYYYDPAAPATPKELTATGVSSSQITLEWMDNSHNEQGFKIERSFNGTSGWTQIAAVDAGTDAAGLKNRYYDTGLSDLTEYYYRVRACNIGGDSGYSNTANATVLPPSVKEN